jgi:hypothetical protein
MLSVIVPLQFGHFFVAGLAQNPKLPDPHKELFNERCEVGKVFERSSGMYVVNFHVGLQMPVLAL